MNRRFRLTRSTDIKRVRNQGKVFAHPLVVLYVLPADGTGLRMGVTTSRALGNAVHRNRAKRLLRAGLSTLAPDIRPSADLLLVGRTPLPAAKYQETLAALTDLLKRAGLYLNEHGG